jgi:putative copper resistance protein D
VVVLAASFAAAYAVGVRRLARRGRSWPFSRELAAASGLACIGAADLVPKGSFTAHMVEHLLLGMVGPLLLALSAPITLALQAGSPGLRAGLRRALRTRVLAALGHPVVGFVLFGASTVALYMTPLLELSTSNTLVHVLVHVHLVAVGCLFVWPLVGADPSPHSFPFGARLLAAVAFVPFHAFLGLALLSASSPLAPDAYPDLVDQRRAAGVLWSSGELFTLAVAAIVCRAWLRADRREAARLDRIATQ